MRCLAIETSGQACSLALFEDERLLAARHELVGRGHAEILIPWIGAFPEGGKADLILVGCGPGSFTGVRAGVAAARGLGLGWGVPVRGFSSLALIAQAAHCDEPVTVAIEGGHGEMFVQAFDCNPLAEREAVRSLTLEAAGKLFEGGPAAGSGAARLVDYKGSGRAIEAQPDARLALSLPEALRDRPPTPVYGRSADARPML